MFIKGYEMQPIPGCALALDNLVSKWTYANYGKHQFTQANLLSTLPIGSNFLLCKCIYLKSILIELWTEFINALLYNKINYFQDMLRITFRTVWNWIVHGNNVGTYM